MVIIQYRSAKAFTEATRPALSPPCAPLAGTADAHLISLKRESWRTNEFINQTKLIPGAGELTFYRFINLTSREGARRVIIVCRGILVVSSIRAKYLSK
ncbi:hypothetical protein EVAR_102142_1 [Eumeta japonica]|uniref:Uncharacterized protein n=1 Tax=Eumeta variegata TaxID=151549 RepID=A0A4C1U0L1_EUMVA|nr:hypothetical protein EVAR_102142_1 [Eumeta japonica]